MFCQYRNDISGRQFAQSAFTGNTEFTDPLRGKGHLVLGHGDIIVRMDDTEK